MQNLEDDVKSSKYLLPTDKHRSHESVFHDGKQRALCIKQTFWPPNFAGKSECSNWMTSTETVKWNNCSVGFGYFFFSDDQHLG